MAIRLLPTRTISGRTIPTGGSCSHGTASATANMQAGSTVIVCRPDNLATGDQYLWSRIDTGAVYRSIRFTGTQVRNFLARNTTNYDLRANYDALPGLVLGQWVVIACVWDINGTAADQRLFCGTPFAPLREATSYATRTIGSGAQADESTNNLRTWSRGGASNGLNGVGHSVWIKRDYKASLDELRAVADAMLDGLPLDILAPTFACYTGLNEAGSVWDFSPNGNTGTLASTTEGAAPPMRRLARRPAYKAPINAYTLTASGAAFTLTGTAATLKAGRYLSAAAGTYTLNGTAATLKAGRYLSAASGAFTLTGTAATLIYGSVGAYTLAANGGTFALTGTDATLTAARRLTASSGTFTLTGTDATLKAARRLTADGGAFALTGGAATLKAGRVIAANGGTFTITGAAAALRAARLLDASGGVFALTGTDATLIYGTVGSYTLTAEGGTFTLSGTAAALKADRRLTANGATYSLTGMDAALKAGRRLLASGGAFTLTGTDAALVYSGARSTAFYVTGRSGVRYQITAGSDHRYIIEAASEPRYRATRRE